MGKKKGGGSYTAIESEWMFFFFRPLTGFEFPSYRDLEEAVECRVYEMENLLPMYITPHLLVINGQRRGFISSLPTKRTVRGISYRVVKPWASHTTPGKGQRRVSRQS